MGTHSNIGIVRKDGAVEMIYVHWDGYLESVGQELLENYQDDEKIRALVALGSLSTLGNDIESCEAYHRDKGEDWDENTKPIPHASVEDALDAREQFIYLWKDGKWFYDAWNAKDEGLRLLTPEACEEE